MRLYMKKDVPADAKVICVIVHGLCEHQGRYDYLVGKFNAAGIGTYRFDHRGHGRSEGERTYYDSFHDMIDDAKAIVDLAKSEHPDKPVFLLGHSMGGFCVSLFGAKYPGAVKGIVMSGALTHDNRRLIADVPAGQDVHGKLPNELGDGVCSVKEVVDWYGKDPITQVRSPLACAISSTRALHGSRSAWRHGPSPASCCTVKRMRWSACRTAMISSQRLPRRIDS